MLPDQVNSDPDAERELWKDARLVSKEAARILCENRAISWYEALRRARIALGYVPEVGS